MSVGIVDAGHREGSVKVDDLSLRAFEFGDGGVSTCSEDFSVGDGEGCDFRRCRGGIVGTEVGSSEDVAVYIDGVGGRLGVGDACEQNDGAEREGFHEGEFIREFSNLVGFA